MEPWQGVNPDRAVYAAQTVSSVATGIGKPLRDRGHLHFEIKPIHRSALDGIGYFPLDRRKEILAVTQRLPIQPVVGAAVDGIEAQINPISGPIRRDAELPG